MTCYEVVRVREQTRPISGTNETFPRLRIRKGAAKTYDRVKTVSNKARRRRPAGGEENFAFEEVIRFQTISTSKLNDF